MKKTDTQYAKLMYSMGKISRASVVPSPLARSWNLQLTGHGVKFILTKQRGGEATYKSIDGACNAAHSIGFKSVDVNFSCFVGG